MLRRLLAIDWSSLRHLEGDAADIPALLHMHAQGGRVWDDLDTLLVERGAGVPTAATAALPFLLELIEGAHEESWQFATIVAELAKEAVGPGPVDPAWPAAWDRAFPRVKVLLNAPETAVRHRAADALGASHRRGGEAAEALRARLPIEPDAVVTVAILRALAATDGPVYAAWIHDPRPVVRFVALLAVDDIDAEAAIEAFAAADEFEVSRAWGGEIRFVKAFGDDPDAQLAFTRALLRQGRGLNAATALLAATAKPDPRVLDAVVASAAHTLPLMAALPVDEPEAFAAALPEEAGVWGLVQLEDERALPPLTEWIRDGGWHHERAHFTGIWAPKPPSIGEVLERVPAGWIPHLLPMLRERLREGAHDEVMDYLNTLRRWGADAVAALPDVEALSEAETPPNHPFPQVTRALRGEPEPGPFGDDEWGRVRRAIAEDDTAALIAVVTEELDQGQAAPAARAAMVRLADTRAQGAEGLARRVLASERRWHYFGGWRVFAEDGEWRRAAKALLS